MDKIASIESRGLARSCLGQYRSKTCHPRGHDVQSAGGMVHAWVGQKFLKRNILRFFSRWLSLVLWCCFVIWCLIEINCYYVILLYKSPQPSISSFHVTPSHLIDVSYPYVIRDLDVTSTSWKAGWQWKNSKQNRCMHDQFLISATILAQWRWPVASIIVPWTLSTGRCT